jgi:hypothetical protein
MTEREKNHELRKTLTEFEHNAQIRASLNKLEPKPNGWLWVLIVLTALCGLIYLLR